MTCGFKFEKKKLVGYNGDDESIDHTLGCDSVEQFMEVWIDTDGYWNPD